MIKSRDLLTPVFSVPRWLTLVFLLISFSSGCEAEKNSLHEMDHELPPHWPSSLEDAAQKIEQRLSRIEVTESVATTRQEIADLIEWTPEVAADSALTEIEWTPIFQSCETLRRHLNSDDISLVDCREDLERLVALLREYSALSEKGPDPF